MSDHTDFREWMDARGLKAEDVAEKFEVSPQTISHWRSQGVPDRRQSQVRYIMNCWQDTAAPADAPMLQTLIVHPTVAQFRNWNIAAISQQPPQLIEEWALAGLDQIAAEWERKPRVAPETPADREERWQRENASKVAEEGK